VKLRTTSYRQRTGVGEGFSLIELLVVITIIGLLASVGLTSYTRAQERARDAKRQSDLISLKNALEIYYAENNVYVDTNNNWGDISVTLNDPENPLVPTYIRELPSDPGGKGLTYRYRSASGAQNYCLEALLETAESTQSTCTVGLEGSYNYGVGNP